MLYGNIEQLTLLPYVNHIIKKLIIEAVKIAEISLLVDMNFLSRSHFL